MDNTALTLVHYANVMTGERVAIGALAIVVVAMLFYREDRKSSRWFAAAVVLEIMHLLGDSGTYQYSLYMNLPYRLAAFFYFVAYAFGSLTTIAFAMYVKSYIEERTTINKWIFRVPVILEIITFCIISAAINSGSVYGIVDGVVTSFGSIPTIAAVIPMIVILYIPIAAMTKVKDIGWRAVFLLGMFGIVPGVTMFVSYDYSIIMAAFALLIVYILLQCGASVEKERQKNELAELNAQLQENQSQLEETSAEQESQLEEINALNAQLQETAAENEAQLEETQTLNAQLQETQKQISEAYGMIAGLSSEYHTIWVVSKETSKMRLVRSSGKSTIQNAVQMGKDLPEFDRGFEKYINTYVEPEDRERMHREIAFAEILHHLSEYPDELYAVNYLRRDDSGHVGYHQIAFANADTADGVKQFVYGFRDIDKIVKEEQKQKEELKTALNLAQEATAEQEAQLEEITHLNQIATEYNEIMSSAGYGMWHIYLKDGAVPRMQVNDKMAQLLGVAGQELSEEALYSAWYDQIVPEAIPSVQKSVGEMMAGSFSENTYQWIHPTKGPIYVRCGGTADTLEDGTNVLSGYHADVTDIVMEEQKHNAELERAKNAAEAANVAKTSFLFNMSHDIRTPMNAIMGFRDLLEKHQDDPQKRADYLSKIENSSSILLSIINNVLEMARIEKGTLEIEETAWSVEQFSDSIYSVFREMMRQKNLTFTKQVNVQHHYFCCDTTKLREIFFNIISNAYKYTNIGGTVSYCVEELPCDREGWALYRTTITDNGIGMSEEFLPHVFEEFAREKNTTEAKIEGTGLGMPIVKRLVEMMNGTIEVRSKKGEGSAFIVTIPHKLADKSDLVERAGVTVDPKLFDGRRILLTEDNDLNAEIATEILSEAGFIVDRAEDGAICVDMLKASKAGYYDLILMDVQMPNMNGYEATKAIRQLEDDDKADIKILAMTANAFEEDKREALKSGMNGHLAKPINVNELMKTLAKMLG